RFGLVEVVDVEQRADQDAGCPAQQDADRASDDADDQADDAAGGGPRVADVADLVLDRDRAVVLSEHDRGALERHLALLVELPELGQRLVGVAVPGEIDREYVLHGKPSSGWLVKVLRG